MEINQERSLELALLYAKKFGFISKSLFWKHLTPPGTSTKYRYWAHLMESKLFSQYKELKGSNEYLYPNHNTIRYTKWAGERVSKRIPIYFHHDEKVQNFAMSFHSLGLIKNFWSEQELRANRGLALDLLGSDYSKLPDLVFDLNCRGQQLRASLEVETSRKVNNRYFQSLVNYNGLRKIDLVIYGAAEKRIVDAIKESLSHSYLRSLSKKTAFYFLSDFENQGLTANLEINSNQVSIGQFINNVIEIRNNRFDSEGENREKSERMDSPQSFDFSQGKNNE